MRSLESSNSLYYHSCCCSFSRRAFSKVANHPPLQTSSVLKIPSFKDVRSADDLFRWLLDMISTNVSRGQKCFFPSLNRYHVETEPSDDDSYDKEVLVLRKRLQDMKFTLSEYQLQVKTLESSKDQLLHSTKHWYGKYQELLEQQDNQVPKEFLTPQKRKTNCMFDILDNEY